MVMQGEGSLRDSMETLHPFPTPYPVFSFHLAVPELRCCLVTKLYSTLFRPPWSIALQVPLSMGFPRQEYWSGLPFPSPGDFPNAGIEPTSPALAGGFFTTELPGKPKKKYSLRGVTQHTFIPGMWYSKQDSASAGTRMNLAPVQSPSRLCVQPS